MKLTERQAEVMTMIERDRMAPVKYRQTVNSLVKRELITLTGEETDGMIVCAMVQTDTAHDDSEQTVNAAIVALRDRVAMAADINGLYQSGNALSVRMDGVPRGRYTLIDATAVRVYLTTHDGSEQTIDTVAFHAAMNAGQIVRVASLTPREPLKFSWAEVTQGVADARVAADVESVTPFRTRFGKVKSTSAARRYRKGA